MKRGLHPARLLSVQSGAFIGFDMADSSLDIKMQDLKLSDSPVPALSPDVTPGETHSSMFETSTPVLEPSSDLDAVDQEAEVEELLEYDMSSLKSADVKTDPILASLARKQGRPASQAGNGPRPSSVVFKARPAPTSTRQDGLGPRMTKSAALRQGLDWAALNSPVRQASTSEASKTLYHVPGQKRDDVKVVRNLLTHQSMRSLIPWSRSHPWQHPSLPQEPQRPPCYGPVLGSVKGDPWLLSRRTTLRKRSPTRPGTRKSGKGGGRASPCRPVYLPLPSSVYPRRPARSSDNLQAPRQNKTSALRTGAPVPTSTRALTSTTAANVEQPKPESKEPKTGLGRRASMGVRSLGTPSIVSASFPCSLWICPDVQAPRLNRAALLRAPGPGSSSAFLKTAEPMTSKAVPTASQRTPSKPSSATSGKPSTGHPTSVMSPRPTKASLLRAGLGAKVYSREV